jgi:hypothetical protein
MTLARKIKTLMQDRRLGVIAKQVGVHPATLCGYRSGQYMPACDIALRLAEALNVDPGWLIDDRQGWPPVPAKNPNFPAPSEAQAA